MLQRVYLLRCPNEDCGDTIVLPRQSHLGTFEYPRCQPMGAWPIDYLCRYCGQMSSLPSEAIRLEGVEAVGQIPLGEVLCRYSFSSDHARSPRLHWLYAKGLIRAPEKELIDGLLIPTGTWKEEYGKPRFAGVDPLPY